MLDYKRKDITAKLRDERIAGSTYRIYSCHFARSTHFLFHKIREKEDEVGGGSWGLGVNKTPIDMSSFYLPDEFFFSSELRRHSEMTLHHGVSFLANENV